MQVFQVGQRLFIREPMQRDSKQFAREFTKADVLNLPLWGAVSSMQLPTLRGPSRVKQNNGFRFADPP